MIGGGTADYNEITGTIDENNKVKQVLHRDLRNGFSFILKIGYQKEFDRSDTLLEFEISYDKE
ncbi:MAG: hypothetical protein IEMM0008_0454 [bacterium]|nr:MAG: hypothetical protein IEMM0008_0454 [bacterium]